MADSKNPPSTAPSVVNYPQRRRCPRCGEPRRLFTFRNYRLCADCIDFHLSRKENR